MLINNLPLSTLQSQSCHTKLASDCYVRGDLAGAKRNYTKVIKQSSGNSDAYLALGNIAFLQQDYAAALANYDLSIKLCYKHHPFYHYTASVQYTHLGNFHLRQDEFRLAIQHYEKAIFYDHNNYDAYHGMGYAYYASGKQSKSRQCFALVKGPVSLYPAYEQFKLVAIYDSALEFDFELNVAIGSPPCNIHYVQAYEFAHAGDFIAAIEHGKLALNIEADNAAICYDLGLYYYKANDLELSKKYLTQALELFPAHSNAHFALSRIGLQMGEGSAAFAQLTQAINLSTNAHDHYHRHAAFQHCNRGYLYLQMQQGDLAITDFNKALDLDKNSMVAMLERAKLYLARGSVIEAYSDFSLVLAQGGISDQDKAKEGLEEISQKLGVSVS
ncbi:MAG: hypothetical protein RIT35_1219 [Pseudomonadota bacterium]|jgi:tetratricopeptide (TPR) repeat protein